MTPELAHGARPATPGPARAPRLHPALQLVLVLLCSLVVCAPLLVDRIRDNPGISQQDELSYIDTLVRIQDGQWLQRQGQTLDPETLQELGCRGVSNSALVPDAEVCAGAPSDVVFYNTADIDPPLYHWSTAVLAHVPYELGLTQNMVTAARLIGVAWCTLTMTAIFFLARGLGARVAPAAAAAVAVLWLQGSNIQFQYVTPHSTGMLVGALVAMAVAARLADRVPWWVVTLAGMLATSTKLSNVVVIMAGTATFLVAFAWRPAAGGRRPRRRLWDAANLAGSSVLVALAWVLVRPLLRASDVEPYGDAVVERLTLHQVLENLAAFVNPLAVGYVRGFALLLAIAIYGTAAWLLLARRDLAVHRFLSAGLLAAAVAAPVALVVMNFLVTGYYVVTQNRYGLSLLPLGLALAASQVRHRGAGAALVAVSVACLALTWITPASLVAS